MMQNVCESRISVILYDIRAGGISVTGLLYFFFGFVPDVEVVTRGVNGAVVFYVVRVFSSSLIMSS